MKSTGKEIGCGAYGRVFEVEYDKTLCAAKELHAIFLRYAQREEEIRRVKGDFLNECHIWSSLQHPCIVEFIG